MSFRVKSSIRSFRDLFVYQKTIQLSNEISNLTSGDEILTVLSKQIPQLIAESYGDKFDSKELAHDKLTKALKLIAGVITRIDLLRESGEKEILDKLLTKYITQKRKILNLRRAWDGVYKKNERNLST